MARRQQASDSESLPVFEKRNASQTADVAVFDQSRAILVRAHQDELPIR
jgi:hypothetical protein